MKILKNHLFIVYFLEFLKYNLVTQLIKNEIDSGIPSENIIIGGFSQGGVVSLYNLLTTDFKLGGAIILSGYLSMAEEFVENDVLFLFKFNFLVT